MRCRWGREWVGSWLGVDRWGGRWSGADTAVVGDGDGIAAFDVVEMGGEGVLEQVDLALGVGGGQVDEACVG